MLCRFTADTITGRLLKHAMTGRFQLLPAVNRIMDEVLTVGRMPEEPERPLGAERPMLSNARKLELSAAAVGSQKHMTDLPDQQEIIGGPADCVSEVFTVESCILLAEKMIPASRDASAPAAIAITRFYAAKAMKAIELAARKVIVAVAEGDTLRTQMAILRRLAKYDPVDTMRRGRQIAQHVLNAVRYIV